MAKNNPKRKSVEIYFVLYLAALVFLLPNGKEKHNENNKADNSNFVSQLPFKISAEKSNLTAKLSYDTNGIRILTLDSNNNIYYSGNVKDVKFEFIILDNVLKQSLHLSPAEPISSKYFRLTENKERKLVSFFWKPSSEEKFNKNYTVQVIATAKSNNDNSNSLVLQDKTQFGLNIIFEGMSTIYSSNSINQQQVFNILDSIKRNEFLQSNIIDGSFDLIPEKDYIRSLAYQKWSIAINAYNINLLKDLKSQPAISAYLDKAVYKEDLDMNISNNKIIISGKTPAYGKLNVNLKAIRKSDGKEQSISFNVLPLPIEQASIDKIMYPGKKYSIDPKLPLTEKETKAVLKSQNLIRARSTQGEKFYFTPDFSDTGKIFTLERYIDNQLIGEDIRVKVNSFPIPEIIEIQQIKPNEIKVKTRSYGYLTDESNLISFIEITGNAQCRELYGRIEEDKDKFIHLQTFIITPKTNDNNFKFSIKAIDKLGKKSNSRTFNQD